MRKPVGRSGPFEIEVNENGMARGSYTRLPFPSEKHKIEGLIATWFMRSMTSAALSGGEQPLFTDLHQNEECDFDFSIRTPRGPAFLELQEVAPLSGPYETAPASYKPYDLAQLVLDKILAKSAHYAALDAADIFLLVYVTHWSFTLSESTIACLRVWLNQRPLVFRAVFSFTPLAWGAGATQWLFPVPPELRDGFNPESIRSNVCHNFDSAKFRFE